MGLLNQDLFQRLEKIFPSVRIQNQGTPLCGVPIPKYAASGNSRLSIKILKFGETYVVNCPFCGDTRGRLWINHKWGTYDQTTKDDNLHLLRCFNENCFNNRVNQMELHELLYPVGQWTTMIDRSLKPAGLAFSVFNPPVTHPILLPAGTSLADIPDQHPAALYVSGRGFDRRQLAVQYGIFFVDQSLSSTPSIRQPSLIIPIHQLSGRNTVGPSAEMLVGWQARAIGDGWPKYRTSAGMKTSQILYGLPQATATVGPVVVVEGAADVWRVGRNAVALLGKTISNAQSALAVRQFRGRPIVVWLDPDAAADALKVVAAIRVTRRTAGDNAPVVVAKNPPGRKDPGECTPGEVQTVIEAAIAACSSAAGRRNAVVAPAGITSCPPAASRSDYSTWLPGAGQPLLLNFAFSVLTASAGDEPDGATPEFKIGVAADGRRGYFVEAEHVAAFFNAHLERTIAFHDAPRALEVINAAAKDQIDIYVFVDRHLVFDVQLSHRLWRLATTGDDGSAEGTSSLANCVLVHLKIKMPGGSGSEPSGRVSSNGAQQATVDPGRLKRLADEATLTRRLAVVITQKLRELLRGSSEVWGFAGERWLNDQMNRWGVQTHHIQLKAAIVLRHISAVGLHVDMRRRKELHEALVKRLEKARHKLVSSHGIDLRTPGWQNTVQQRLAKLQRDFPELKFLKTPTGSYATGAEELREMATGVPFIKLLLEAKAAKELLTTLDSKLDAPVLKPSFNVFVRSGRTSSFGEINAQNLPKDDQIRSSIVPSPGHVFLDADFDSAELRTLAQAVSAQFQFGSELLNALNTDSDIHRFVAARLTGKNETDVTPQERNLAKPFSFGLLAGMGDKKFATYAKNRFGVFLSAEKAIDLRAKYLAQFPDLSKFIAPEESVGFQIASLLRLTVASYESISGNSWSTNGSAAAAGSDDPCEILGSMARHVFWIPDPLTRAGKPYGADLIDYCWTRLSESVDVLPPAFHSAVTDRRPSEQLSTEVVSLATLAGVFTFTGRLRARATSRGRRNTIFQGLAADGMKLAMWKLHRAGYRIVNEIHDQFLIEVATDSDLTAHARRIEELMIAGMQEVVPDVTIKVSLAATDRWYTSAKAVFDDDGKLTLWQPFSAAQRTYGEGPKIFKYGSSS